jgi:hypothetical protein
MESSPVSPKAGGINQWLLVDAAARGKPDGFFAIGVSGDSAVESGGKENTISSRI